MTATKEKVKKSTKIHEMIVADPGAPVRYKWNGIPAEAKAVREEFDRRMATGLYLAYETTVEPKTGVKKHEQIRGFVEDADQIILAPRLAGGC